MGKVRLELVADFGPNRGKSFSGIVVEPKYDAIMRAGLNKLNLREGKKKLDLILVLRDRYLGARVLPQDADLSVLLRDGATVVLTKERPVVHVPKPPRWPWPGGALENSSASPEVADEVLEADAAGPALTEEGQCAAKGSSRQVASEEKAAFAPPQRSCTLAPDTGAITTSEDAPLGDMCGPWAVLQGDVLPLVRQAILPKNSGFIEKHKGAYIAFDYHTSAASELPAMFPDPQTLSRKGTARLLAAVRRECRGLLVCANTGRVLARRLPKFFNIDEVEETRLDRLPKSGGIATRKLDGSLVSPFLLEGSIRWAGKSAIVPDVEHYVAQAGGVANIALQVLQQNCTPIFEWCQAGPPVGVITHTNSCLVLIAVRDMTTGEFWSDAQLRSLGCAVVDAVPFDDLSSLMQNIRLQTGSEGLVVAWPEQGHLVKLKTNWWLALSAAQSRSGGEPARALLEALNSMPLSSIPPMTVWQAVLDGEGDQMSAVYGRLTPESEGMLRSFAAASEHGIDVLDQELREWAECAVEAGEADLARVAGGWPRSLLASYQRRSPAAVRELRKFLLRMAGAGYLPGLEALLCTRWDAGRQETEFCGHLGTFEKAPANVCEHVLNAYFPQKLQDYMGCPISEESLIKVPRLYEPSEGKIRGFWEKFRDIGIIDLRVDLQPRAKHFDFHNGDADFAHWQVQYGPNDNCRRSTKAKEGDKCGAFAGVLLRTGVEVMFGKLRDAMKLSFESQKVVRLDPSPSTISHIYMDLDGVLVDFEAGFEKEFGSFPDAKVRWQHIEKTPGFYDSLPWMEGARKLWDHVQSLGVPVSILTGIPHGSLGERSASEKRSWVERELGTVDVITCLSSDKPTHSGPGRLLIDDRSQSGWEAVGGRQILHRTVSDTLFALVDMGLGRPFSVPLEKICVLDRMHDDLRNAVAKAETIAIDAEWPPDRAGGGMNRATVLQLAFRPSYTWRAFIVDMLAWDEELEAFIKELLASDLPKLVFGTGDEERLHMRLSSAMDLQAGNDSLAVHARRAGLVLRKSKQLQAADWSLRPLRDEQLVYAATDAAVLLELGGGHAVKKGQQSSTGGRNASVEYVGVFLTPDSRQKLLRLLPEPPRFPKVVADHMTLVWMPESVKGLSVGAPLKLTVQGVGSNDKIQAVSVVTHEPQPRSGHVTISHRQDVEAVEANSLEFHPLKEPFVLNGVIGVGVVLGGVDKSLLPEAILARVTALTESQPGKSERFENLTDSQRYALHVLADELGLEHTSEGKKGSQQRKLFLRIPKRWRKPQSDGRAQGERQVVKDAKKFAAIFGDVPGLRLHGRVTRNGVLWEPGVTIPLVLERLVKNSERGDWKVDDRLVVILRGFPGSGKSSLSSMLKKCAPAEVIGADHFWAGTENLQEAHEKCRQSFSEALQAQKPLVIVDNTNVRRSEYEKYRSKAETEGYAVVILEMICESTSDLERFRKRSVHDVPGGAVGAMWSRWEQDPSALRLAPYDPQEFLQWLQEQGMCGRPSHAHTHMVMPNGPFISVPPHLLDEFHERHVAEWGRNYISEVVRTETFQLFFDIDKLGLDVLVPTLSKLRDLVGVPLVLTGFVGPPPGYHIFAVGKIVNSAEAFSLRQRWLEAAPELGDHVDDQLYKNPQLRLVGSRKISKEGIDTGRVHEVIGRFDIDWQENASWAWKEVTIHSKAALA
mmetsp:Transcript_48172/g.85528  ORF Transcript_48172/g.85528 Transcript_48172/m.85528 type:complete len:1677 (-) Transcript_48172:71-5101(-)